MGTRKANPRKKKNNNGEHPVPGRNGVIFEEIQLYCGLGKGQKNTCIKINKRV